MRAGEVYRAEDVFAAMPALAENQDNALEVLRAGADSVAVIAGLIPDSPTAQSLRERMEQWQQLVKQPD